MADFCRPGRLPVACVSPARRNLKDAAFCGMVAPGFDLTKPQADRLGVSSVAEDRWRSANLHAAMQIAVCSHGLKRLMKNQIMMT
jgi:hypothetical protein